MSDKAFMIAAIAVLLLGILMASFDMQRRASNSNHMQEKFGCDYIGTARDMPSVAFLNCDGKVELKLMRDLRD